MRNESAPDVCVDFDGVVASWAKGTFYQPGPPIPGARKFLQELSDFCKVVIYTCRTKSDLYDDAPISDLTDAIWGWLIEYGLDRFVSSVYVGQGKPYAACYVDDKAVRCDPESGREQFGFDVALLAVRCMCNNGKQHPMKGGA